MKIKRIDHVGVIVASLERAQSLIGGAFGLEATRQVKRDDLMSTFYQCGGADLEMIEVTDPAMREKRLGEGNEARVEHIAFEVESLDDALIALAHLGIETTGPPQQSPAFTSVWTDPATSGGVVYQFLERRSS